MMTRWKGSHINPDVPADVCGFQSNSSFSERYSGVVVGKHRKHMSQDLSP
jgi:hypothetical protein